MTNDPEKSGDYEKNTWTEVLSRCRTEAKHAAGEKCNNRKTLETGSAKYGSTLVGALSWSHLLQNTRHRNNSEILKD